MIITRGSRRQRQRNRRGEGDFLATDSAGAVRVWRVPGRGSGRTLGGFSVIRETAVETAKHDDGPLATVISAVSAVRCRRPKHGWVVLRSLARISAVVTSRFEGQGGDVRTPFAYTRQVRRSTELVLGDNRLAWFSLEWNCTHGSVSQ